MVFDFRAAKAWIGGLMSGGLGGWLSSVIIGLIETGFHIDIPANIETIIATGVATVVGWLAVYFTPNKQA